MKTISIALIILGIAMVLGATFDPQAYKHLASFLINPFSEENMTASLFISLGGIFTLNLGALLFYLNYSQDPTHHEATY